MAVQKQGGKSKKGRQHVHNESTHKYAKQQRRTAANKRAALELHLKNNPNDEQNKVDIKEAMKQYQL